MKRLLILIAILLVIQPVSSLEASNPEFLFRGNPVGAVSNSPAVSNTYEFQFLVQGENFEEAKINLSELNTDPLISGDYNDFQLQSSVCEQNGNNYTCALDSLQIYLENPTINIPISLYNGSMWYNNTLSYTFTMDNTKPRIVSLKTDYCTEDGDCYFPSDKYGKVLISFEDAVGSFEKGLVKYSLNDIHSIVAGCEGMDCHGYTKTTCESGRQLSLKLLPYQSADDAYNRVQNSISKYVTCDADIPEEQNFTLEVQPLSEVITMNNELRATITVTDPTSPIMTGKANFSGIGVSELVEGDCAKQGHNFTCTFESTVGLPGYYETDLNFYIQDLAGNTLDHTESIEVLESENETIDLWTVSGTDSSPGTAPAGQLQHDPWRIFQSVKLTPKLGGNQRIIEANLDGACQPMNNLSKTYNIEAKPRYFDQGLLITYTLPVGDYDYGEYKYNCTYNIYTRKGNVATEVPEKETLEIGFEALRVGDSAEKVIDEINRYANKTKKRAEYLEEWQNTLQKAYTISGVVCAIPSYLHGGATATGIGEAVTGAVSSVFKPAEPISEGLGKATTKLTDSGDYVQGWLAIPCGIMTCNPFWVTWIENTIADKVGDSLPNNAVGNAIGGTGSFVNGYAESLGYSGTLDMMDPYKSMPIALLKMCPPAILQHQLTDLSVDCSYLSCLQERALQSGASIASCRNTKNYQECMITGKNVLGTIPLSSMADNVMGMLQNIAADPFSYGLSLITGAACDGLSVGGWAEKVPGIDADKLETWNSGVLGHIVHGACFADQSLQKVQKNARLLNLISNKKRETGSPVGNTNQLNFCQDVSDNLLNMEYYRELTEVQYHGLRCDRDGCSFGDDLKLRYDDVIVRKVPYVNIDPDGPDGPMSAQQVELTPVEGEPGLYQTANDIEFRNPNFREITVDPNNLNPDEENSLLEAEENMQEAFKQGIADSLEEVGVSSTTAQRHADNVEAVARAQKAVSDQREEAENAEFDIRNKQQEREAIEEQIDKCFQGINAIPPICGNSPREQAEVVGNLRSDMAKLENEIQQIEENTREERERLEAELEERKEDLMISESSVAAESKFGPRPGDDATFKDYFKASWGFASGVIRLGQQMHSVNSIGSNLLGYDIQKWNWLDKKLGGWLGGHPDLISSVAAKTMCQQRSIEGNSPPTSRTTGRTTLLTPGAFITGSKTVIETPEGTDRKYFIYGEVINTVRDGLEFSVYLKGDGQYMINESITVNKGEKFPSGSPLDEPFLQGNLTGDYDKACIKFASDPDRFFQEANLDNNELCSKLVVFT